LKLNNFLLFLAFIVGAVLGNLLLSPSVGLQLKILILSVMVAYAGILSYCDNFLEDLDAEVYRRRIDALFESEMEGE